MSANEPHAEAALHLIQRLRAMQGEIDEFAVPPNPLDRYSRPSGPARYPDAFFAGLAFALEASPLFASTLESAGVPLTAADIRDMLRYDESYLPVAEELERFARGIRYTINLRRDRIGRLAARAYAVAKALNLVPDADVSQPVPEVEAMRRAFGPRRRKASEVPTADGQKDQAASGKEESGARPPRRRR